jgi:hypothetical protein
MKITAALSVLFFCLAIVCCKTADNSVTPSAPSCLVKTVKLGGGVMPYQYDISYDNNGNISTISGVDSTLGVAFRRTYTNYNGNQAASIEFPVLVITSLTLTECVY